MKIYFVAILLFVLISNLSLAQNNVWFSGVVTNDAGDTIRGASIIVMGHNSKEPLAASITGKNGEYIIELPNRQIIDSVYSFTYKNPATHKETFYPVYKYDSSVLENDTVVCKTVNYDDKTELIEGNNIINFVLHKKSTVENYTASFDEIEHIDEYDYFDYHKKAKQKYYQELKQKLEKGKDVPIPMQEEDDDYYKVSMPVIVPASFSYINNINKYMKNNIIISDYDSIKVNIKGIVKVGFTVDKIGKVSNVNLIKGVNKFVDKEVIRAVKRMPRWQPAIQNGQAVEDYKEISVMVESKMITYDMHSNMHPSIPNVHY